MSVPEPIHLLVQHFEEHKASYKSGEYNEAQARLEFIDPFFEALGWDMFNKQGYAAAKTPNEKTLLQRQIDLTDREINRLVYELYELTEAKIRIVEAGWGVGP